MYSQVSMFEATGVCEPVADKHGYRVEQFSADSCCPETQRQALEAKYAQILEVTDRFDRRSVSYQLSKKDALHSWLKYKEGFSAELVNLLLDEMDVKPGDWLMDPFMGSGTTALVCQERGVNCIGYDILPTSTLAIEAKAAVRRYDVDEITRMMAAFRALRMPDSYPRRTPHILITEGAYPDDNARMIEFATEWIEQSGFSADAKRLFKLCMVNSLERCSYTSKSGQYLSWDSRSPKVIEANRRRAEAGRRLLPAHRCRAEIEGIQAAVLGELEHVRLDINAIQSGGVDAGPASIHFKQASALFELPSLKEDTLDGVITSPPYCNRYDYTRTYALELAYLGLDDAAIKRMRQALLSCTVENKPKLEAIREQYAAIGKPERYDAIVGAIEENAALQEVRQALKARMALGDLNNNGVVRMVEGYFTELAFIYAELYRACKRGAMVAFVNDNVRYGGEIIPVDFISTSLAEQFGFTPLKVYCLKQQKGNSSQQMKRFGRVALRKSITLWVKR